MPEAGTHKIGGSVGNSHGSDDEDEFGGGKIGGRQKQQGDIGQPGHEDTAGHKGIILFNNVPAKEKAHGRQDKARAKAHQGVLRAVHPGEAKHAPAQADGAYTAGDAPLGTPEKRIEFPQAQGRHQQNDEQQGPAPQPEHQQQHCGQQYAGYDAADVDGIGGGFNGHLFAPVFCQSGATARRKLPGPDAVARRQNLARPPG